MPDDHILTVRLKGPEFEALQEVAAEKGLPISTCARMLVREALQARQPVVQARLLLGVLEMDPELRLLLRRLVLNDPER